MINPVISTSAVHVVQPDSSEAAVRSKADQVETKTWSLFPTAKAPQKLEQGHAQALRGNGIIDFTAGGVTIGLTSSTTNGRGW